MKWKQYRGKCEAVPRVGCLEHPTNLEKELTRGSRDVALTPSEIHPAALSRIARAV
jgi:hypothetical protein